MSVARCASKRNSKRTKWHETYKDHEAGNSWTATNASGAKVII